METFSTYADTELERFKTEIITAISAKIDEKINWIKEQRTAVQNKKAGYTTFQDNLIGKNTDLSTQIATDHTSETLPSLMDLNKELKDNFFIHEAYDSYIKDPNWEAEIKYLGVGEEYVNKSDQLGAIIKSHFILEAESSVNSQKQ